MPHSEQTPLLQTVVVAPPRERYSGTYVRRFCSAALGFTTLVVIILFLVPARWLPGNNSESEWLTPKIIPWTSSLPYTRWPLAQGLSFDDLKNVLLKTPDEDRIRKWSQYYTAGPHLAGKNYSQAHWTRDAWRDMGIPSEIVDYDVYINYPLGHRLALLERNKASAAMENRYECSLEEDVLDEDPTTGLNNRIPTFHGYGASGNVTAQYVYVNFGTYQDFEDLLRANITLHGLIAIAKYGRVFRGLKIKRAQELGMIGVVLYTDPEEDGEITEQNGYEVYPNGPARQPSSVQRGSAQFLSVIPGDPTTPGYASKPGAPRVDPHGSTPQIPSLPISYKDAIPLLRALNGHGPSAMEFGDFWHGGKLCYKGVEYNIGPSPPEIHLNLIAEHEYVITPIWNVIGVINGTLQDEVIVMGNHRDAWIAGGAGDPNSGSAAMNEVVRSFSVALKKGWKPLRTIVLASWDGEEYGLLGSTEWVEEYMPWLKASSVAYLNVDVGARGPAFDASASPLLNKLLYEVTALVQSPNQTVANQTVRDTWPGHISTMGSGSDFTAFQDCAGIPSVDLGFAQARNSAVYHYHSNFDSFAWMNEFGDKGWHYHVAITKIWALLAATLVETPILHFNITTYANSLQTYLERIITSASTSTDLTKGAATAFPILEEAIQGLKHAAIAFDAKAQAHAAAIAKGLPWWRWWQRGSLYTKARYINQRYQYFERKFLYAEGLDSRPLFKHVVFAPGLWTGYSGATFPGLIEAVDNKDHAGVVRWTEIIRENINNATSWLRDD